MDGSGNEAFSVKEVIQFYGLRSFQKTTKKRLVGERIGTRAGNMGAVIDGDDGNREFVVNIFPKGDTGRNNGIRRGFRFVW